MKKTLIIINLLILIEVTPHSILAADPPPPEPQTIENDLLGDAMTLIEIYYKIRRLSSDAGGSELKPYLDQINKVLDRALAFKESFTPEKKGKVEAQLKELRKETARFADIPPSKMKAEIPKLTDSLWKLIKVLMDS